MEDGRTAPAKVRFVKETKENAWIEITVSEGRNRLIKRMCASVGHPINKLKRTVFAGIKLTRLKVGEFRFLTEKEVERLQELAAPVFEEKKRAPKKNLKSSQSKSPKNSTKGRTKAGTKPGK